MLTCVTFDNGWDGVQGLNWLWVLNSGVQVMEGRKMCRIHKKCGYFDGQSNLEIPFFSSGYDSHKEFALSLFYKRFKRGRRYQGLISNDCFQSSPFAEANSLYVSTPNRGHVSAGLRSRVEAAGIDGARAPGGKWHHLAMSWNGTLLTVYKDGKMVSSQPFEGPIRRSHCPLVIGSFINQKTTFFKGFMDEICFFRTALSSEEVTSIKAHPTVAYDM
ncbi:hypothetical protein LSAT2_021381 [Lamellibrachia satsuma]|nr:hypothetical protein LSAT2_021381 [Lamellibrachia satsuma]